MHKQLGMKDDKGLSKTIVTPEDNAVSAPRFMAWTMSMSIIELVLLCDRMRTAPWSAGPLTSLFPPSDS
jgi:hypothetical protein